MRVDEKAFIAACDLFREINNAPLEDLDLSKFGGVSAETRAEWKFAGLNNTTLIKMIAVERGLMKE